MSDDATTVTETETETGTESPALGRTSRESSSDDQELSDNAYEQFKKRKSLKRKRPTKSGKRGRPKGRKVSRKQDSADESTAAETTESEEEDLLEELPDYIRNRRAAFDRRKERLREAGLRLPPSYDDVEFSDDENLEHLNKKPNFPTGKPIRAYKDISLPYSLGVIPASIAQWLREYQVSGVSFLHKLFVYQKGGILGDDMGLGKTIQVISFLTAAFGKTADERDMKRMRKVRRSGTTWYPRVLIVCPGTLFENWKAELNRWGFWHIDIYHADTKETAIQAAKSGRTEIMLTTYVTYRENKGAINMVPWDCVIADECHIIKGRKSETTKAMNEVNALCRIGLTGTAIQNTYDELWTLLNWTNPGVLGPISVWKSTISAPLKQGQSHTATMLELGKARKTAKALTENLLPRFFLRRLKTLIADQLPKKTDRVVFCPLTETQADAYERFLDSETVEFIKTSSDVCGCGSKKKAGWCCRQILPSGGKWQEYVFPAIMNLQKMANHLAILIPQDSDMREKQERDLKMLQEALPDHWRELYRTRSSILHYSNTEFCGKWRVMKKLLRFWHDNGDKVLVFSHSVRLLRMLRLLFQSTAYNVSYLDGSMSLEDRAKEVDTFNADSEQFVFLISTKAGGVGLNITSANKVVIFDPNWNPSYDLQAQDRAYRLGQTRDVEVFRLVSAGTIEEIVYARQIYKQQQANIGYTASKERRYFTGVQENKDQKGEIFGLQNLFAYQGDNIVLRNIVNKTNVAESRTGVAVADVDMSQAEDDADPLFSSQSDDEEGAMSQLVKVLTKGEKALEAATKRQKRSPKTDPIQAILAQAGIEYTHENSEVIGSSKVERKLSRRAEEAAEDIDRGKKHAFVDVRDGGQGDAVEHTGSNAIRYRYHPPEAVKKRQFCTMAKTFGFKDATQFALVVEGWTQEQRRDCLDRFYAKRQEMLGLGRSRGGSGQAEMG